MRKRRNHEAGCKVYVALETVNGERTMLELAAEYGVHPAIFHLWKKALLGGAADIFERGRRKPVAELDEETVQPSHAKIGSEPSTSRKFGALAWSHGLEKEFITPNAPWASRQWGLHRSSRSKMTWSRA